MNIHREVTTFEKNVESILVSQDGIFIIYDYNQPMRKPNVLYKHQINLTTTDNNHFFLELSDSGYLRIVYLNGILKRKTIINVLNLNDYFFKSFLNDDTFDDSSSKKEILLQDELTTTTLTTTCHLNCACSRQLGAITWPITACTHQDITRTST